MVWRVRGQRGITTLIVAITVLGAACELQTGSLTSPSAPSAIQQLLGSWTSATEAGQPPSGNAPCRDIDWSITQQSGDTYSGSFSAVCEGVALDGVGTGTLIGDALDVAVTGTATLPDLTSCPFSLDGTATLQVDGILVDYTGTTCAGDISGSSLLSQP